MDKYSPTLRKYVVNIFLVISVETIRSVVGERGRGAEGGEERLAKRSRSETPAAEPQTEALRGLGAMRLRIRDHTPSACKQMASRCVGTMLARARGYRNARRHSFLVVHNAGWSRGANHRLRGRLRA